MQPVRLIDLVVGLLLMAVSAATGFGVGVAVNAILSALGAAPNAWIFGGGIGLLAGATSILYYGFLLWHYRSWFPQVSFSTTATREAVELRLAMSYGLVMGGIGWETAGASWSAVFGGSFAAIGWYIGNDLSRRHRRVVEQQRWDSTQVEKQQNNL
jgi:hypothetical protein